MMHRRHTPTSEYSDGYEDTPHKKSSTKKPKKKGTGLGVCQTTKKKHNLVNLAVSGPCFLNICKMCADCDGYVIESYMHGDDLDALRKDFQAKYGLRLRDVPRLPEGAFLVK